jgi:hypothetical protein
VTVTQTANGETLITGLVVDQAALYGLLRTVRDLGLPAALGQLSMKHVARSCITVHRRRVLSHKRNPRREPRQPMVYHIRIWGHLSDHWGRWFAGFTVTLDDHSDTRLCGPVVDQAALHSVLKKGTAWRPHFHAGPFTPRSSIIQDKD